MSRKDELRKELLRREAQKRGIGVPVPDQPPTDLNINQAEATRLGYQQPANQAEPMAAMMNPFASSIQGLIETGQGAQQLGVAGLDYLINAPIKNELGIAENRMPQFVDEVKQQRAEFESQYGDQAGSDLFRTGGAALPFLAMPPARSALGLGVQGANIAGSQFFENPEERAIAAGIGGAAGVAVPMALAGVFKANELRRKGVDFAAERINRLRGRVTPDVARNLAGDDLTGTAQQRLAEAKKLGLDYLTPAEASDDPILALQQGQLGKTEKGMKALVPRQASRVKSERRAIRTLLDDITPDGSPVNEETRAAAQRILGKQRAALSKLSKPLYKKAYADIVPDDFIASQMDDPLVAKAASDVSKDPALQSDFGKWAKDNKYDGPPEKTVKYWDLVRRKLSDLAEPDKLGKSTNENRIAGDAARSLNSRLDDVSPNYKEARNFFSEEAPRSQKLEGSRLAKIAKMDDTQTKSITRVLFDRQETDPRTLTAVRNAIIKEDPNLWNRVVRMEMERRIDLSKGDLTGSSFYKQVLASPADYRLFHNALSKNPVAQRKLRMMKNTFGRLINPRNIKSVEGQARINVDQPRNVVDATQQYAMNIVGEKMDRAAVEFITNPQWNKEYARISKMTSARQRGRALIDLLNSIGDDIVSRGVQATSPQINREQQ